MWVKWGRGGLGEKAPKLNRSAVEQFDDDDDEDHDDDDADDDVIPGSLAF